MKTVFAAVVLLLALAVWRGTVSGTVYHPRSPQEGPSCVLAEGPDGSKPVHCEMLVAAPLITVWNAITQYERFPEIFVTPLWKITSIKAGQHTDEGTDIDGILGTMFTEFPFHSRIRYQKDNTIWTASWNEADRDLKVNRGSWKLSQKSPNETLIAYTLDVSVQPYPDFLVKNCLLTGLPPMMESLKKHLPTS